MNKHDIIQCMFVAILAGTVFFQIELSFRTLRDQMGVVSLLHMMNLQLQWEWSFDYTCLICNCNGSVQLVTSSQFTTTRGVVSR
jgi:hypothetical protein